MDILLQLTEAEQDRELKRELIVSSTVALHYLASVLATNNRRFWEIPTDRLLVLLNADVPGTIALFEANTKLGLVVNEMLDLINLPDHATRAPVVRLRDDIVFDDESGCFRYVAPPPAPPVDQPPPMEEPAPQTS